jgi:hypothetical protein
VSLSAIRCKNNPPYLHGVGKNLTIRRKGRKEERKKENK